MYYKYVSCAFDPYRSHPANTMQYIVHIMQTSGRDPSVPKGLRYRSWHGIWSVEPCEISNTLAPNDLDHAMRICTKRSDLSDVPGMECFLPAGLYIQCLPVCSDE